MANLGKRSVKAREGIDRVKLYGLDDQAVKAARQWRFKPGTKDGKLLPVVVPVEMSFTLK